MKSILITGSNGFVGQAVTSALLKEGYRVTGVSLEEKSNIKHTNFIYHSLNLCDCIIVENLFKQNHFSHVVHFSALAHTEGKKELTWNRYYRNNVLCSKTVFNCSVNNDTPIFFSSTIDVYGVKSKVINQKTTPKPVGYYAISKKKAEELLLNQKKEDSLYLIARFAPIFLNQYDRDIQKRYYVRYPFICYFFNNGIDHEFIQIGSVINLVKDWIKSPERYKGIVNCRDSQRYNTKSLVYNAQKDKKAIYTFFVPGIFLRLIQKNIDKILKKDGFLKLKIYKIIFPYKTKDNLQKVFF